MKYSIDINLTDASKVSEVDFNNIPFGKVFSDHMFMADYEDGEWKNFEIVPFQPLNLYPSAIVLHYAQTIFEGMKVMKNPAGEPVLFRPEMHSQRLNRSARRMAMPELPEDLFLQALTELISIDHNWIPNTPDSALYVRPFMIANDQFIGVRPSETYKFIIFTAPVGAYYSKPVKLWATDKYVRAIEGGTGFAKAGGNYAASLLPQREAQAQGFDQVMWLDGIEHKYIHECGTMNLFFVIDGVVVTPSLDAGTVLAGITRNSFIHLLKARGYEVQERPITIDELVEATKTGKVQDVFGAGTAAVVAPVESVHYKGVTYEFPEMEGRKISKQLKIDLNEVRSGQSEDTFGWTHPLNVLVEG
ncbi:MAG: branched-chain amino acid aminotransferase [Saprospiraceae bacterium]